MLLHLHQVMCVFGGVAGPAIILSGPDAKAWSVVDEPLDSVAVRAGAYYGEGKADCLIGNHVAPQISLKGRNLLTPEEAHWHHLSFM